jgi:YD repeat-containing protein
VNKFARRFAIGALAAIMAFSAVSAQAAVSGDDYAAGISTAIELPEQMPQELKDAIIYHSVGFGAEAPERYVAVSGSVVSVNAFSGNVYFELSDLPIRLCYNSLGNNNVGYGPNFMSDSHPYFEKREDGTVVYYEGTGGITHFGQKEGFPSNVLYDERNWSLEVGSRSHMYGNSNTRPWLTFDIDGRFQNRYTRLQSGSYLHVMTANRNSAGLLTETKYQSSTVKYEYNGDFDELVFMISTLDSDGKKYTLYYNDQWNLERVENEAGDTYLELEYDASGRLVTRIGNTKIQYDDQGRAVNVKTYKSTGALEQNVTFQYANGATLVTKTDGSKEVMRFDIDGARV